MNNISTFIKLQSIIDNLLLIHAHSSRSINYDLYKKLDFKKTEYLVLNSDPNNLEKLYYNI